MTDAMPRDWRARRKAAEIGEIAERHLARARKVTTPIYLSDEQGLPEHEGTGVFLQLGALRFLLTAGHVLEATTKRLVVADCDGTLQQVTGDTTVVYGSPDKTQAMDPIDVRVVRLKGDMWESIPNSCFLQWQEVDHRPPTPRRDSFGLVGYPSTKQRDGLRGSTMTARAYPFLGIECPSNFYAQIEVDAAASVLIGFNKKRVWGPAGLATAPDLYGASGCGLWSFGRTIREESATPRLSGIGVIWEHMARVKYVRGTRISLIIAGLTKRYDDVSEVVRSLVAGTA